MTSSETNNSHPISSSDLSPMILLSGDNARSTSVLHQALLSEGLQVDLAPTYRDIEPMWLEHRHPLVLLEVSGAYGVEAAVKAALELKRQDPLQFVAYIADPALHSSGLAGDGIFPRTSEHLARELRRHFRDGD